ncbi:MAG: mechanosensitive ion channel [Deferribacterota bacterium]|nr:mechanosensitive ion channel [Deferribacterota bacterium]
METIFSKIKEWFFLYGFKIVVSLIILVIGIWLSKRLVNFLNKIFKRNRFDPTIGDFLLSIIYYALIVLVFIIALSNIGIQTSSIIALIAAAGLAIGLSLQNSLSNFASGIIIITFRPFNVGDFVKIGDVAGSVEKIGIFGTYINTYDNLKIFVPNSKITSDNIINYAANDKRMHDIVVSVSYSDDIKKVKDVLLNILKSDERVLDEPEPYVMVKEFAESSINFGVRPWVSRDVYWPFLWDFNEKVKIAFDKEGITIPFPQRDIYIKEYEKNLNSVI